MTISPGESTQVRPKIRLLTLVGGGTKSRTTPSRFRVTRVLHKKNKNNFTNTIFPCEIMNEPENYILKNDEYFKSRKYNTLQQEVP